MSLLTTGAAAQVNIKHFVEYLRNCALYQKMSNL